MKQDRTPRERPATAQRKQELLQQITLFVDAHLGEHVTLQAVSSRFGVSVSTVTQLFQFRANTSFHKFLTERRMAAAEELIRRGIPLEEVGKRLGYTDHSSFYRAFRKQYGMSPRDYKSGKEE